MSWVCDNPRLPGNGGQEISDEGVFSLSVPLRNSNQCCLYSIGNFPGNRGYRSAKRARATDYEADFFQREMERLTIRECETSEQAVLGNDPNDRKILERGNDGTENPAFLSLKFIEFDSEIETIEFAADSFGFGHRNFGLKAYQLARDQNKAFVDNPQFKIGFLRAERYHPKQAVYRMFRYLEEKYDMFGSEKLTNDICLEDLGEDGKRYLEIGGLQILPKRDKAGRLIVLAGDSIKKEDVKGMREGARKGMFYVASCIEQEDNEEGKIKGFVSVQWRVHNIEPPDAKAYEGMLRVWHSVPLKTAVCHLCRPNTSFDLEYLNAHSRMLLPVLKNARLIRFVRSHYGTAQECKYTLMNKYGCPDCLPIREGISIDTSNKSPFYLRYQKEWLAKRKQIESTKRRKSFRQLSLFDNNDSFEKILNDFDSLGGLDISEHSLSPDRKVPSRTAVCIEEPSLPPGGDNAPHNNGPVKGCDIRPSDVLGGKSRALRTHPGNVRLRQLVADSFDRYYASKKLQKTEIAQEIAQQIERDGGRFMKQTKKVEDGLWVEVSDNEARERVTSTFRNIVKEEKRKKKTQTA